MRIRELGTGGGVLLEAMRRRQRRADRARPAGLHLSDILASLEERPYDPLAEPIEKTLYEIGDIIEEVAAEELKARQEWVKPEPKRVDGIWCSPDGWSPRTRTIDEVKSTQCSSKDGLDHPKLWKYQIQVKAYMYHWHAVRARLHVVYLRGNYRTQPFPESHTYILRPEDDTELERNWAMIVDHARDMAWIP